MFFGLSKKGSIDTCIESRGDFAEQNIELLRADYVLHPSFVKQNSVQHLLLPISQVKVHDLSLHPIGEALHLG